MPTDQEPSITIAASEYKRLKDRVIFLECLEAAGVDNWEGYSDAYKMFNGEDS